MPFSAGHGDSTQYTWYVPQTKLNWNEWVRILGDNLNIKIMKLIFMQLLSVYISPLRIHILSGVTA